MTGLFDRLASAFLSPPGAEVPESRPAEEVRTAERAGSAAILCAPRDALAVGGAAALLLARRCGSPHAVVAVWGGASRSGLRAPAAPGARRLAARLRSRDHDAEATGGLVVVTLAGELNEAAAEATRVSATVQAPTVVVLAGPRDGTADHLLREQDCVLVALAAEGDPVGDLALAGLAPLAVQARAISLPTAAPVARGLASAGIAALPPLRAPIEEGLG